MQELAINLAAIVLPYIAKFAEAKLIPMVKQFVLKRFYEKADNITNKVIAEYSALFDKFQKEENPAKKVMQLEGLKIGAEIIKATADKYKQFADAIVLPE